MKQWLNYDKNGLWVPPMEEREDDWTPEQDQLITDIQLPEYKPDKFGYADGSRPQFDAETQTWHPYKEPVEPSPEMQAINQIGLQVAKLMVGGKSNG